MDEIERGEFVFEPASFSRRERERSARISRLQFSDDVIFRIGVLYHDPC